jgi:hypothetical protein
MRLNGLFAMSGLRGLMGRAKSSSSPSGASSFPALGAGLLSRMASSDATLWSTELLGGVRPWNVEYDDAAAPAVLGVNDALDLALLAIAAVSHADCY